jgi:hypothetical protein
VLRTSARSPPDLFHEGVGRHSAAFASLELSVGFPDVRPQGVPPLLDQALGKHFNQALLVCQRQATRQSHNSIERHLRTHVLTLRGSLSLVNPVRDAGRFGRRRARNHSRSDFRSAQKAGCARLVEVIHSVDLNQARREIAPFVADHDALSAWSVRFFLDMASRVGIGEQ